MDMECVKRISSPSHLPPPCNCVDWQLGKIPNLASWGLPGSSRLSIGLTQHEVSEITFVGINFFNVKCRTPLSFQEFPLFPDRYGIALLLRIPNDKKNRRFMKAMRLRVGKFFCLTIPSLVWDSSNWHTSLCHAKRMGAMKYELYILEYTNRPQRKRKKNNKHR